ncbi:MAG: hypothetical protein PV344_07300 [Anaplasma sp.]|nr:hypothetical protein [Anaplasma sp.]
MERDSVIGPRSHRLLIRFSCSRVTQRPSPPRSQAMQACLEWPSQYRDCLATQGSWIRIPPKILRIFL